MLVQRVIFNVTPFGNLTLTNRANIAVFFSPMLLHVQKAVAFEVADFAFELDYAGMNSKSAKLGCNDGVQVYRSCVVTDVSLVNNSSQK